MSTDLLTPSGHKTRVEEARNRVVCEECAWFKWMPGDTRDDMFQAGRRHKDATKIR